MAFWFPSESNKRLLVQGWHYVDGGQPFSLKSLIATYYTSVGRGGVWITSPAPDKTGLIPDDQAQRLREFGQWHNQTFGRNLLKDARLKATSMRGNDPTFGVENVIVDDRVRYWAAAENVVQAEIEAEMPQPRTFDVLAIEEQLAEGQHVARFVFDAWLDGQWRTLAEGTTIGRRRAMPLREVTTSKVRLRILDGRSWPALRLLGVYRSAPIRVAKTFTEAEYRRPIAEPDRLEPGLQYQYYESDVNNGFVTYQSLFSEQDRAQVKPVATGNVEKPDISVARRAEHSAIRFSGYVKILKKGVYTFHAAADDGVRIYLGNDLVVADDNCAATGGESQAGDVALDLGCHPIAILYYNGPGMRGLDVWLEGPGVGEQGTEERRVEKCPLLFFRQASESGGR